jgi:predicted dehydrogenase
MSNNRTTNAVLRAAIVGCGQIAGGYDNNTGPDEIYTHAKAYQIHPATMIVAVADQISQRANEFSKRWGNPEVFVNTTQMLTSTSPDIVSICTPDSTHAELLKLCLDFPSVKAVWTEKPLTTDIDNAKAIVSDYKKKGKVLAVNYQRRWDPEFQKIKTSLRQGELGQIQKTIVYYSKGICHNGSHAVDLLLDWFGPPKDMYVFASLRDYAKEDPTVDARLLLGNVPVYLLGLDAKQYSIFEIHVLGSQGRVNIKNSGREIEWFQRQSTPAIEGYQVLMPRGPVRNTYAPKTMSIALEEIIQAIPAGNSVRSNGETALETLKVCIALAEQAQEIDLANNL